MGGRLGLQVKTDAQHLRTSHPNSKTDSIVFCRVCNASSRLCNAFSRLCNAFSRLRDASSRLCKA